MPPSHPGRSRPSRLILLAALLALAAPGRAAEFASPEWDNPGRAGSSLWIKNGRGRAVALDTLYLRSDGLRTFGEVAFDAGGRRVHFAVTGEGRGRWIRLAPLPPRRRLRVGARDSLMLSRFECGRNLRPGKGARRLVEEYALDLKVVDDRGDSAVVALFQSAPRYDIPEVPPRSSGAPGGGRERAAGRNGPGFPSRAWGALEVTQGDLNDP